MRNTVSELQGYFCPFGYLDMQAICKIWDEVDLREDELFDIIDNSREDMGYSSWDNFDPVYSVLEHVVQSARNKISEVTGYDFMNDYSGSGSEIYAHGNFMCSSIDYSDSAKDELTSYISDKIAELMEDKFCEYLFKELDISGA